MKIELDIPEYSTGGVGYIWDKSSKVECAVEEHEVVINANVEGLKSLAIALLSLSQRDVPEGSHIHLDDFTGDLVEGSLVLQKKQNWE
jgi:hypothetical protein